MAAIRNDVSALLKSEIETTPGSVRRLLRPRPNKEIAPGSQLDPLDVEQTEARVAFICACRHYAAELALSEATMRAHSELTHILDTGTKILLESLRQAGNDDRPFRQSQLEAGIRFCRPVFGAEYAGTSGQGRRGRGPGGRRAARRAQAGAGVNSHSWGLLRNLHARLAC